MTRWDIKKYARKAYAMGIRYIGGCCGFEPYHVRAIAEEVRTKKPCLLNPLRPSIKLQIILLCFHTFITDIKGRSC